MSAIISQAASKVTTQLQHTAGIVSTQLHTTTNKVLPPKQREQIFKDLHAFANRSPKLATFLAAQVALTALPIVLFTLFAISTLLISLSTCFLVAVTTAFTYTFFVVGIALCFLVPTLLIASFAATCAFLWGLAFYMLLRRFNDGEEPAKKGTRMGAKLHELTGGRLEYLCDGKEEGVKKVMNGEETTGHDNHDGWMGGGNESRHGGDGHLNADGGWEAKWSKGTQQKQIDFAKRLDIKVEAVHSP